MNFGKMTRWPRSYERILSTSLVQGMYELPLEGGEMELEEYLNRERVITLCKRGLLQPLDDEIILQAHRFAPTKEGRLYLERCGRGAA